MCELLKKYLSSVWGDNFLKTKLYSSLLSTPNNSNSPTTPSNLFMTAQGGKLIWVEAMRCCSEEIFLNAISEVWRWFDEQPNKMKNASELEMYQETLQKISLVDNKVRIKGEPMEV